MVPDDEKIVAGLKGGDRMAAIWLNDKYYLALCSILKNKYRLDKDDAGSVANDTLMAVINGVSGFEFTGPNSFRSWLFTILYRNFVDLYRKDHQQSCLDTIPFSEENDEEFSGVKLELAISALELANQSFHEFQSSGDKKDERIQVITDVMKEFNSLEQDILLLYFCNTPHKQIAKIRNCSEDAAKVYVNRLWHRFIQIICNSTGQDKKVINENWKRLNS